MFDRFPPNSRYHKTEVAIFETPDGRRIPHLKRRFLPASSRFELIGEHTVVAGDRIDNIAAQRLGDSLLYWRVCDANGALRPGELTAELGRRLRITMPEGIPGGLS